MLITAISLMPDNSRCRLGEHGVEEARGAVSSKAKLSLAVLLCPSFVSCGSYGMRNAGQHRLHTAAMAMGTAFGWRSEANYGSPVGFFACSKGNDYAVVSVPLTQARGATAKCKRGVLPGLR